MITCILEYPATPSSVSEKGAKLQRWKVQGSGGLDNAKADGCG